MNLRPILGTTMLACSLAGAAEPAPDTSVASPAPNAAVTTPDPGSNQAKKSDPGEARKPLDLRVRDIREYLTAEEYRALMNGALDDQNTVIVQANAPPLPMKSELDVPGGIIAPFWGPWSPRCWRRGC